MRDKLGWAGSSPAIASAQARISGDPELQSMMELLKRANVLGNDTPHDERLPRGPLTGPADIEGDNIFEKSFRQPASKLPGKVSFTEEPAEAEALDDPEDISPTATFSDDSSPTSPKSAPASRRTSLKRTYTDVNSMSLQAKLMEALAQPFSANDRSTRIPSLGPVSPPLLTRSPPKPSLKGAQPAVHTHHSKWAPAAQAVFRTDSKSPWTIVAANDLACLIFGVTQSEVRKLGILEVVQKERRQWLEDKLRGPGADEQRRASQAKIGQNGTPPSKVMGMRSGITAQLLSKTPSRENGQRRAQTDDGAGGYYKPKTLKNHPATKSRGVLLCGDVVPIQKRNGHTGSASFWVMEKRGGLIWVLEEITENTVNLTISDDGSVSKATGEIQAIWGHESIKSGTSLRRLVPELPAGCQRRIDEKKIAEICKIKHFTAYTSSGINIPITITRATGPRDLRISSFPHIAGIMVLSPSNLKITSSNPVFSAALFGFEQPNGMAITDLMPEFDDFLRILTEEDNVRLVDGIVIPEHSFRRARALLALREGKANAANIFLRPSGLPARHHDGSDILVDVQMRVVRSETIFPIQDDAIEERDESDDIVSEVVYALWITYSRNLHSAGMGTAKVENPLLSRAGSPLHQPSPGQTRAAPSPEPESSASSKSEDDPSFSLLTQQLREAQAEPISDEPLEHPPPNMVSKSKEPHKKKTINDFTILEEMGQGAYGQVKLGRYKKNGSRKMVIKYVTKRRILVDTWTRDRRLGTVPLEIHVMDYLRRDGMRHENIVEMVDFFEDDINYYIEMLPHGIPGVDLFDYIELRTNMEEGECRNIFKQVSDAIHHLHTKALVVHRDIKDENIVLDGEGKIKLIDFGSAAYIKNGPFDVFVGTIDYAAPEVLQGRPYRGKEQDVWALGILLYTIVYKENPFYNIEEILDHPLRIPFLPFSRDAFADGVGISGEEMGDEGYNDGSEGCVDLIRRMLDRDVDERISIAEVKSHPWLLEDE